MLKIVSALLITLLAAASAWCADSEALPVAIAPNHKSIRYIGRFDMRDPAKFRFAWPGSSFVFNFEGKAANLLFKDDSSNFLTVIIDDQAPVDLALSPGQTVYRIAEKLSDGVHSVTVVRRNGPPMGPVGFLGVQLEKGKTLRDPPPAKKRFIEVIGDSISVGYGIISKDGGGPSNENCYLTYGAVAARALDADFASIAWSGYGVLRDYRGNTDCVLGKVYDRTLPEDGNLPWNFTGYIPDVVVINLGTNDISPGNPTKDEFLGAYRALVEKVWKHAPKAEVFCAVGPMIGGYKGGVFKGYLDELAAGFVKDGKKNCRAIRFPFQHDIPDGIGGQDHPNAKTHKAVADVLVEAIKKELGW